MAHTENEILEGLAEIVNEETGVATEDVKAIAMPVILYEIWAFVTPGLTRSERRLVWPLLIAALFWRWRRGSSTRRLTWGLLAIAVPSRPWSITW